MPTFGTIVRERRERMPKSQRALAQRVLKPDGSPISAAYLGDIEFDRRNPPTDDIIEQIAHEIGAPREVLFYAAARLLPEQRNAQATDEQICAAYAAFSRARRGE